MSSKLKVAVFPCSSRNARSVATCLTNQVNIDLYGFRSRGHYLSSDSIYFRKLVSNLPGLHMPVALGSKAHAKSEEEYQKHLAEFRLEFGARCEELGIDVVIPTHDSVACLMSNHSLLKNCKAVLATSDPIVTMTCRHKTLLYKFLKGRFYMPRVFESYTEARDFISEGGYVFSKPDEGQGSRGCYIIRRKEDFRTSDMLFKQSSEPSRRVLMEYIGDPNKSGSEITVDCFTRKGDLVACVPRLRWEISNGVSNSAKMLGFQDIGFKNNSLVRDYFMGIAKDISDTLGISGYWFFQMKHDEGCELDWKLMEVGVRPSTGVDFAFHNGVNFPLMSVYYHVNLPLESPPTLHHKLYGLDDDPVLTRRGVVKHDLRRMHFDSVFIDLYDTLLLKSEEGWKANPTAVAFLHQCVNTGKKIVLITRNKEYDPNLLQFLTSHLIPPAMFDGVIQVHGSEKKSSAMTTESEMVAKNLLPIFVDNSFKERQEVALRLQIPTLDVNELEGFLP